MNDLISRQAAIDAVSKACEECRGTFARCEEKLLALPSAQQEPEEFEWCTDCKEYDQTAHCCHRWTKVIRQTVDELKRPTVDAIPISWINAWYYRYRFYTVDVSDMLAGWEAQRKEE